MNKKLVLVLLMATMLAGGAFAQIQLSAGAGVVGLPMFAEYKVSPVSIKSDAFLIGVNGFLDLTYAEVNVGFW